MCAEEKQHCFSTQGTAFFSPPFCSWDRLPLPPEAAAGAVKAMIPNPIMGVEHRPTVWICAEDPKNISDFFRNPYFHRYTLSISKWACQKPAWLHGQNLKSILWPKHNVAYNQSKSFKILHLPRTDLKSGTNTHLPDFSMSQWTEACYTLFVLKFQIQAQRVWWEHPCSHSEIQLEVEVLLGVRVAESS